MDRRSFILGAAGLAVAGPALAQRRENAWVLLGTRDVNPLLDRDVIAVGAGRGEFDHILIKVFGNDLYLYDLDVVYSNGGHDDLPVRTLIPQGGSTRSIDLRGRNRNIRHVSFLYQKPVNWRGRTWIELWGQR